LLYLDSHITNIECLPNEEISMLPLSIYRNLIKLNRIDLIMLEKLNHVKFLVLSICNFNNSSVI
jgi:hypothetical protein